MKVILYKKWLAGRKKANVWWEVRPYYQVSIDDDFDQLMGNVSDKTFSSAEEARDFVLGSVTVEEFWAIWDKENGEEVNAGFETKEEAEAEAEAMEP